MLGLLAINVCYFGAVINVRIYAWCRVSIVVFVFNVVAVVFRMKEKFCWQLFFAFGAVINVRIHA